MEVLTEVECQSRRLPAVRHALVAEVDARGVPATHGVRSTAAFLRNLLRLGPGEAKGWVRTAQHLAPRRALTTGEQLPADLPATAAAQAAGLLSAEHVRAISAAMDRLPTTLDIDDRAAAEHAFVAAAIEYDAKKFVATIERFLAYLDPDGAAERHREARRHRGVTIGLPGPDGLAKISGWLTPLVREAILAVLDTFAAPNPLHPDNVATPDDLHDETSQQQPADRGEDQPPDTQPADGRDREHPRGQHDKRDDDKLPDERQPGEQPTYRHDREHPRSQHDTRDDNQQPGGHRPTDQQEENRHDPAGPTHAREAADPTGGRPRPPDQPTQPPIGTQLRDLRSAGQRLHDALGEACQRILATGTLPIRAGLPATILLIAKLAELRAGSGIVETGHGGTIPIADAVRLAAQAHIVPMVFDTDSSPLWAGRSRRLASTAQRHTVIARDIGCTIPGCDLPAWRCQVHHSPPWTPQQPGDPPGRTDIDTMGLICGYDHHRIDDWTMTIHHGRAWWTPPPWIDSDQTPRTNT